MVGIITGDIVNSRVLRNPEKWLVPLKQVFALYGKNPAEWDIFRGDSFQLMIQSPAESFKAAVIIKAVIKCVKELDVRLAIGIGDVSYHAPRIAESNGEAFVFSGVQFENLKRLKQTMAIKTRWEQFDEEMNLYFKLVLIAMDNWTRRSGEIVRLMLENESLSQQELGKKLGISQASVSERIKRSHINEIIETEKLFRKKIALLI
jgi:hypothetical protein